MSTPNHCDPKKRHDFVFVFDVIDGNPNGDPDAGNLPRVDPETMQGIVTDVSVKRKIRDYIAGVKGIPIFIQNETALNTLISRGAQKTPEAKGLMVEISLSDENLLPILGIEGKDAEKRSETLQVGCDSLFDWLESLDAEGLDFIRADARLTYLGEVKKRQDFLSLLKGDGEPDPEVKKALGELAQMLQKEKKGKKALKREDRAKIGDTMRQQYWDVRIFGAVMSTGVNAGQVRGPMQLTFSRSLHPITPLDPTITRCAITKASDFLRKQTEMGRKPFVTYARYRGHGFYNPFLAEKPKEKTSSGDEPCKERTIGDTFVSTDDLAAFWEGFQDSNMFRFAKSATNGEVIVQKVYIFTHEKPMGNAASHRLFDIVEQNMRELTDPKKERPDSPANYPKLLEKAEVEAALKESGIQGVQVEVLS